MKLHFRIFFLRLYPNWKHGYRCKAQREIKIIHAYTVYMDILKELLFFSSF